MVNVTTPKHWSAQRAFLNHDVLCNQLRTETAALKKNPNQVRVLRLEQWSSREDDYRALFDNAIDVLGPERVLVTNWFSCWSDGLKCHFGVVFREIFLATSNLPQQIKILHQCLTHALEKVHCLLLTSPEARTIDMIAELDNVLDELSCNISALPSPWMDQIVCKHE